MSIKHTNKVRVNVTMSPAILTRIDKAVGPYCRSAFVSKACLEQLTRDENEKELKGRGR
jgi:hypothetical protein